MKRKHKQAPRKGGWWAQVSPQALADFPAMGKKTRVNVTIEEVEAWYPGFESRPSESPLLPEDWAKLSFLCCALGCDLGASGPGNLRGVFVMFVHGIAYSQTGPFLAALDLSPVAELVGMS